MSDPTRPVETKPENDTAPQEQAGTKPEAQAETGDAGTGDTGPAKSSDKLEETTTKSGTPDGTKSPGALFDLDPKEEKKPAAPPKASSDASAGAKKVEAKKYEAGTEVRYQGHTMTLEKEMTAKEVLDWISEDDFPELAYEQVEMRYDKEKNRLVPVRQAQKKGARIEPARSRKNA